MIPAKARTVVYRHPCDCAGASRPLGPGERAEHRFDVDGAPFPWRVDEQGPHFVRLHPESYLCYVRIVPMLRDGGWGSFSHAGFGEQPVICGLVFPWLISEHGISYSAARTQLPLLRLAFFAETVDADCEIPAVAYT